MSTIVETIASYFDGPDAPPAYEGSDEDAHRHLVAGVYYAIAWHGDDTDGEPITEYGWLTVWDEKSNYPSMGLILRPNSSGSIFLGVEGCMMGCPHQAPHNHTSAFLTGEWWA